WFVSRSVKIPVRNDVERSISFHFERVSRHQLADISIKRLLSRQVAEGKILWKRRPMELWAKTRIAKDHLDFRAEEKALRIESVVERLDPQAVASGKELLSRFVPDGEGK